MPITAHPAMKTVTNTVMIGAVGLKLLEAYQASASEAKIIVAPPVKISARPARTQRGVRGLTS